MIDSMMGWINEGQAKVVVQRRPQLHRPAERGAEQLPHPDDLCVEIVILAASVRPLARSKVGVVRQVWRPVPSLCG